MTKAFPSGHMKNARRHILTETLIQPFDHARQALAAETHGPIRLTLAAI